MRHFTSLSWIRIACIFLWKRLLIRKIAIKMCRRISCNNFDLRKLVFEIPVISNLPTKLLSIYISFFALHQLFWWCFLMFKTLSRDYVGQWKMCEKINEGTSAFLDFNRKSSAHYAQSFTLNLFAVFRFDTAAFVIR